LFTLLHHALLAKPIWSYQKRGQEGPKRRLEKRECFTLHIKSHFMKIVQQPHTPKTKIKKVHAAS